jgi:hypothetical protein
VLDTGAAAFCLALIASFLACLACTVQRRRGPGLDDPGALLELRV